MSARSPIALATDRLRRSWESDRAAYGAWITSGDAHIAELLGRSGLDWAGVDAQHGIARETGVCELVRAASAGGAPALVRTSAISQAAIGSALDAGAAGVIVPMVESGEEAEQAVAACRYAPRGCRSWGPLRPAILGGDFGAASADSGVLCFVMVETMRGCEAIAEIAAVPGVDGVFVGPSDLAISCGEAPSLQVDSARVRTHIADVLDGCRRAGVVPGIYAGAAQDAVAWAQTGFRLIGLLSDVNLVERGAKDMLSVIRAGTSATGLDGDGYVAQGTE